jgi:hypothetical protein
LKVSECADVQKPKSKESVGCLVLERGELLKINNDKYQNSENDRDPERISSGEAFEAEVFGKPTRMMNNLFEELLSLGFEQAKRLQLSEFQWNPMVPSTKSGQILFQAVKKHLPNGLAKHLRFYVAVGTPLDLLGIDCFFTLPFHRSVTVDLKLTDPNHYRKKWWRIRKKILTDIVVSRDQLNNPLKLDIVAREIAMAFGSREPYFPTDNKQPVHMISSRHSRMRIREFRKLLGLD